MRFEFLEAILRLGIAKYGGECAPDPEPRDEAEVPTPPRDATAADPPAPGASAPPEAEAEAPQHFD